ncbi:TlpA family protein disulfide reductase [bacterium]|nr:TlpA family protein disulfide reductase [bacterium]
MKRKQMLAAAVAAMLLWVAGATAAIAADAAPAKNTASDEEAAWKKIETLAQKRISPLKEGEKPADGGPTEQQIKDYQKRMIAHVNDLMLATNEFQKKYPKSAHMEENLRILAGSSFTLAGAPAAVLIDPNIRKSAEEITRDLSARKDLPASVDLIIVQSKMSQLQMGSRSLLRQKDKLAELIKRQQGVLQEHRKRYPKDTDIGVLYVQLAEYADEGNLPAIERELLTEAVGFGEGDVKEAAAQKLKTLGMIGKPVDIKFTALDGRKVDLAALKGKVVLIDFWATWCVPCVQEFPNVLKVYNQYHDKGFEIIGISLDADGNALKKFIKDKNVPWPQYFDGKEWENQISSRYGVDSIPAMWLVGKDGNVATLKAREDLEANIKTLLGGGKLQ